MKFNIKTLGLTFLLMIILVSTISFGELQTKLSVYYNMDGYATENENNTLPNYNLVQTGNPLNVSGIRKRKNRC